jgi:hypothetical protein
MFSRGRHRCPGELPSGQPSDPGAWQQCFTWCNDQGKQKWLQIITLWLWILHHNSLWPRILHKTASPRKFCLVRCPPNTLWNLCEVVTKLRDVTLWVHKANKNRNLSPTPKKPSPQNILILDMRRYRKLNQSTTVNMLWRIHVVSWT